MLKEIKLVIYNRLIELKHLFVDIKNETTTFKKFFIFVFTLFFVVFYVTTIILLGFVMSIFFIIIIIFIFIINSLCFYKTTTVIEYNNNKNNQYVNIYIYFLKNIFIEVPKKYTFYYIYLIINIFNNKLYSKFKFINFFDFIFAVFLRLTIVFITHVTVLILKVNIQLNKIINSILIGDAVSWKAYLYNILTNIVYKLNINIDNNLLNAKIII